jgi:hypothetical protein
MPAKQIRRRDMSVMQDRCIILPDGKSLRRSDLPSPNTRRWVASRKALVVQAVNFNLISRQEACEIYALSDEELESWMQAVGEFGVSALKATALQKYRQPKID